MKFGHLLLVFVFSCSFSNQIFGQDHPRSAHCDSLRNDTSVHCALDFFAKGTFHGHIRNYFMSTISAHGLSDFYANAAGGALGYHSARIKGFSIALKGQFTYNIFSNDLLAVDQLGGRASRYELQLFDVVHPNNRNDLDRLEELYIDYLGDRIYAKAGKIDIVTPLVNPQDGRMKPYAIHGLWVRSKLNANWVMSLGAFNKFSPRSTTHWYHLNESIGIYGNGYAINGKKARYQGRLRTNGLLVAGAHYHNKLFNFQGWNYYIDNISNTFFGQAQLHGVKKYHGQFKLGLQYLRQWQLGEGGNSDSIIFQYHNNQDQVHILSGRLAYRFRHYVLSLNGLQGLGKGRFLFPREWGREQFYVTVPRGRVEGTGGMQVLMLKAQAKPQLKNLSAINLSAGYFNFPEHDRYDLNKYGMLSHYQFTIDMSYKFHHLLEGSSLRLLYINKFTPNSDAYEPSLWFNSSHFQQINVVFNVVF
ncbi:MAG: hypothetical protein JXQ87_14575 [Bacteroidia bacterium]